jgi:hypothetical protein
MDQGSLRNCSLRVLVFSRTFIAIGEKRWGRSVKRLSPLCLSGWNLFSTLTFLTLSFFISLIFIYCNARQCIAGEGHETLPPSHKIPAMHALLMDKSLFKIFLTMLSSKCTDVNNVLAKSNRGRSASFGQVKINAKPVQSTTFQNRMSKNQLQQQQQQQQQLMTNRKRALSISSAEDVAPFQSRMAKNQLQQQQQLMAKRKRALSSSSAEDLTPNKSMKLMRSPMQQGKEFNKVAPSNGPALPALAGPMHSSLDINFSVLAAVVFYSVFQYLEQWPAVFVRL